ncbi:trypsin-like serine protease, partial [Martensiomyces pterosporus]
MVSTKRSISSILFLGALSSVVAGESARLLGGVTAPEGMFPYIVHLFKNGNPYCGGTLIDYQWVVTAAHCVAERDGNKSGAGSFVAASASEFKVGFGTNSGSLVNSVDVDSITVNSAFDPVWYTLGSSNNILTKAKTITISNGNISAGQTVITAGWGQTTNDSPAQSSQLMYAGLVTADDGTCQKGASDWNGQNGRYVCTSYSTAPGIGTCFGDSGGPLLINTGGGYTLLGLVSFDVNTKDSSNTRCAQNGDVSYFTRISSYLSFISSTTG